ncbi:MAG TPA: hypothetical protein VGV89_05175 [Thermoplasmata archaeon]|nr:hypothetical protein [Thermoplasmata archaeon]
MRPLRPQRKQRTAAIAAGAEDPGRALVRVRTLSIPVTCPFFGSAGPVGGARGPRELSAHVVPRTVAVWLQPQSEHPTTNPDRDPVERATSVLPQEGQCASRFPLARVTGATDTSGKEQSPAP